MRPQHQSPTTVTRCPKEESHPRRSDVPTVLQWNCRGLSVKHSELSLHLQRYPSPVLALAEAGLPGKQTLPGYVKLTTQSIPSFPHGSAALFIRRGVPHVPVDTSRLCTLSAEFVAAKVSLGNRSLHVLVGYVRPDGTPLPTKDIVEWCKGIEGDLLLCGDFNAHCEVWGSQKTNKRGDALNQMIEELGLVVANNGAPTFFRPPRTYSVLDVTAHTPSLELTWETAPDTRGSDHFPIHITIKGCQTAQKVTRSCTNWDVFRASLDLSQTDIPEAIVHALQAATRTSRVSEWLPKPDLTFLNLQAARTRAQRKYRRTNNPADKSKFNRISAKLRRHAKALVRNRWKLMCKDVNAPTSLAKLWAVLGAMTGKRRTRHALQVLALAANVTLVDAAERLGALYAPAEATERPLAPDAAPGPLDAPFTAPELQSALRKCRKKTAAGPDGIPYQALTNLTNNALEALLTWFNSIWDSGDVPEEWKVATVVPLLKPGKPPDKAESYRPISLTSCISKLFERLVQWRLRWYLEERMCLPECMTGFRRGLAAQDSILDLTSDLEENKNRRRNTVAVFLDVERAYDGVPPSTILRRLTEIGLTGKIQVFLANFLTGRKIQIQAEGAASSPRLLHRGLPQRSVLSPILFNMVMAPLPHSLPSTPLPVQVSIYADDICLWVTGIYTTQIHRSIQSAVQAVDTFLTKSGLSLSQDKTVWMPVRGNGRRFRPPDIKLAGKPLTCVNKQRFLGIVITSRLRWAQAVKATTAVCRPAMNAVRHMTGTTWGCTERTITSAQSALVTSRILYRLPYMFPSQTDMERLEQGHRRGLRTALGIPNAAKNAVVLQEAGAEPLTVQARARRLSQLARLSTTLPGRWFLQRIQARTKGSWHDTVEDFLNIAGPLPTMTSEARVAPWEVAKVSIELRIKRLRAKKVGPINALREAVEKHIEERYGGWLQIYTDGSVNKARTSSTAAFYIPELALEWCGRLQAPTSSTTAELVAIDKALQAAAQLSPHRMVLLTDSRCALQKLANAECADPATTAARQTLSFLLTHGSTVCFQWIPGHTGIKGNERADSLAGEAHLAPRTVPTPPHPQQAALNVHWHLQDSKPKPALPRGALSGLSRAAQTLVRRLRTNTAYTNAFLTKIGKGQHPLCSQCNSAETVEHILCVCPAYETQRAALRKRLGKSDLTTNDILAPDGSGRKCQNILKAMLAFLRDTKTITRL